MIEYHKIHSPWKRDARTKVFDRTSWARPEFETLAEIAWRAEEKVDGTNIRVLWGPPFDAPRFGGRTNRAQLAAPLVEYLRHTFAGASLRQAFPDFEADSVILVGEGYGAGIQNGGLYVERLEDKTFRQRFVLFDVLVVPERGHPIWLKRPSVEDIAAKLKIPAIPVIHDRIRLGDAIAEIEHGAIIRSRMPGASEERLIEGFVLKPECDLLDRMGRRVITKIKYRDFKR